MPASPLSRRAEHIGAVAPFRLVGDFYATSTYGQRRGDPTICDFTFGNPHEMPDPAYVAAIRDALEPRHARWFAYADNLPVAQEAAAASLGAYLGAAFAPEDILLTTGGFGALALGMKLVADPGEEVVYSLPPWFLYEALAVEAGLVPVKVRIDLETYDLNLDAIAGAITPRTRVVIVNTPNNPTGRIYPPETLRQLATILDEASDRHGRRIYLLSDEPYNRLIFDGATFHSPTSFYPYTLLAYSYGKTHLAPGQRIGYLALPPTMPDADRATLRQGAWNVQVAAGWIFPNAAMQYALPRLEQFTIDVGHLQRKRDRMVEALREMGYGLACPEGTFYLFARSPIADDVAFAELLAAHDVFVLPGAMFETPGYFRVCLTANTDMIERSLPGFSKAIATARAGRAVPSVTGGGAP